MKSLVMIHSPIDQLLESVPVWRLGESLSAIGLEGYRGDEGQA